MTIKHVMHKLVKNVTLNLFQGLKKNVIGTKNEEKPLIIGTDLASLIFNSHLRTSGSKWQSPTNIITSLYPIKN